MTIVNKLLVYNIKIKIKNKICVASILTLEHILILHHYIIKKIKKTFAWKWEFRIIILDLTFE